MERKIGEVFEFCGKWYQCLKSDGSCADCAFLRSLCGSINDKGICRHDLRKDATNVIFKKLEKIGETYQYMDGIYQKYKATLPFFIRDATYIETTNGFAIKQNKEDMNKLNLKPFDLESAKAGKPVCTRAGRKARIVCFDAEGDFPIVALVKTGDVEEACQYTNGGFYHFESNDLESDFDLMMLSEKRNGWIVVSKNATIYDSLEDVEKSFDSDNDLGICKIEWEE